MVNRVLRGATVKIEDMDYPCPDLVDEIREALDNENENPDEVSASIIEVYADATPQERSAMDDIMAAVTGYTLKTLLRGAMAEDDLLLALGILPE